MEDGKAGHRRENLVELRHGDPSLSSPDLASKLLEEACPLFPPSVGHGADRVPSLLGVQALREALHPASRSASTSIL